MPIVIAYHLIWTVYGWWLPNDPRGSTSRTVASDRIAQLGEHHFGRKRTQPRSRDVRAFYERAATELKHPLLQLDRAAIDTVAESFADTITAQKYTCWACAIMPDHVHILIRKHRDTAEQMIERLQNGARDAVIGRGMRDGDHPVWTDGAGWSTFLDHPNDVERTIGYIRRKPPSMRLPDQHWSFVKPYDRWPLHDGHDPHSPYARGLRAVGRYP